MAAQGNPGERVIEVTPLVRDLKAEPQRFEQRTVRLGRHPENDIVFNARHVSARHGEIAVSVDSISYRDLATPNGSFVLRGETLIAVDAERDYLIELEEGDVLYLGDPDFATGLSVRLIPAADHDLAEVVPLFEVLSRLDISDESKVQRLSAAFDRSVLLALQQHTTRVARSQHLPTILESFVDAVLEYCPKATHVSVYLKQEDEDEPSLALMRSRRSGETPTPLSTTVWRELRERRDAFSFEASDPAFNAAESLKKSAVRIGMCVPIWTGESLMGLVQVDGRGERRAPFTQRDLEALAVFASQLSVSVQNARLHGELEDTVSRLKRAQSEMQRLAFRDPVTGLSNRLLFQDRLAQAVRLARRHRRKAAVLYVDFDGFKDVNDRLGHDAGDMLLKSVAKRLRDCLREQDTVARVGGDEFAAVLCDIEDQNSARLVARKMLEVLRDPVRLSDTSVHITASVGITLSPDDATDVSRLIRNADLAMYRAKGQGGDTFQFFTEDMNRETARRLSLQGELREALMQGQFVVHYQPMVRLVDSRIAAVEALLRWDHPLQGMTKPNDFLPVADEAGLGLAIGEWCLEAACRQANSFDREELDRARMAVNLSPRQLADPGFARQVSAVLEATGLEPARLEVEVSENALVERPDYMLERLRRLKQVGVSICVEDFGTGRLSLDQLKRLPIDALKIDRAFVQSCTANEADRRVTAGLIALAHKLGVRTVAEGVESWSQLEFLKENECDLAQGYLFSRPRPAHELSIKGGFKRRGTD